MNKPRRLLRSVVAAALLLVATPACSEVAVYRETPQGPLTLEVRRPAGAPPAAGSPAVVFFFGGGWIRGGPQHFERQAEALAARGAVTFCADYRTRDGHGTSPFEAVADAAAALRWVRAHAAELGVDPERIAAAGGSAGGHLAAALATPVAANFDEAPAPERAVSSRPDALVLFNPVFDNGPGGYGHERVRERWERFSPLHNLVEGMPPTLTMLGGEDRYVPVATAEAFRDRMRALGARSELIVYPGQPHGFFNRDAGEGSMYDRTLADADAFLVSLGWLEPEAPAGR